MLFATLLVTFTALGCMASANTLTSGTTSYSTSLSGKYPNYKSTIYKKEGSSAKTKLVTVDNVAALSCIYKDKLFFTTDRKNDSECLDLYVLNLTSLKYTILQKNAEIHDQYGKYLLTAPNTGALMPLSYYVVNSTSGKIKKISSKCLGANFSGKKIYYFQTSSSKVSSSGTYKGKVYRCSLTGGSKKAMTKNITIGNAIKLTSTYIVYYKSGSYYKYTYKTKKTAKVKVTYSNGKVIIS